MLDSTESVLYIGGFNLYTKYTVNGGAVTTIPYSGTGPFWPQHMILSATGSTMYISDTAAGTETSTKGVIWTFTVSSSVFTKLNLFDSNSAVYTPGAPKGMALNSAGTALYVCESLANKVSKVIISNGITRHQLLV